MNVAKWVLLAALGLPFLELVAFIAVVATIGLGWALVLILAGSLAGALVLRRAGRGHVARIRVAMERGSFTALHADTRGSLTLLAGILLLIPGLISDILAILLLIGALRHVFIGAPQQRENGVVDLAPEQWHQVPDPSLPDHRKDERRH